MSHEPADRTIILDAMNVVRVAISFFILLVIAVSVSGWIWTGSHQPAAQAAASRVVLSICVLTGLIGLRALWSRRPVK
jgi:hypothetical protein